MLARQHTEAAAGQEHIQQKQFEEEQTQNAQPQYLTLCLCRRRILLGVPRSPRQGGLSSVLATLSLSLCLLLQGNPFLVSNLSSYW